MNDKIIIKIVFKILDRKKESESKNRNSESGFNKNIRKNKLAKKPKILRRIWHSLLLVGSHFF